MMRLVVTVPSSEGATENGGVEMVPADTASPTLTIEDRQSVIQKYKEYKENEINNLSEEQKKLKNQLDENKLEYEKVIEKTANQIENFLTKIDSENSLQ